MTSRETLARELTRARERTLRLVDFDDAELGRQYDPLMSPLVWDLAHIGQQEELWLLRGGNPDRPGMLTPDGRTPLRRIRELPRQPGRPAAAVAAGCPGVLRDGARQALDALDALPDDDTGDADVQLRPGGQPREPARRNHAAGAEPAGRAAAARPRNVVADRPARDWPGPRCWCLPVTFVLGVDAVDRAVLAGQRTARTRRRCAGLPHRPGPGHQRRVAAVHRRRRLRRNRGGGRTRGW